MRGVLVPDSSRMGIEEACPYLGNGDKGPHSSPHPEGSSLSSVLVALLTLKFACGHTKEQAREN